VIGVIGVVIGCGGVNGFEIIAWSVVVSGGVGAMLWYAVMTLCGAVFVFDFVFRFLSFGS
jgi:hypothetical protein